MTGLVKYGTPHPERSCTLWRVTGTLCTPSPSTTLTGNSRALAHHLCPESFRMAYPSSFPCFFVVVWNREMQSLSLSAGLGHGRVTGVVITMGPVVTLSHNRSPCPFFSLSLSLPSFWLAHLLSLSETRWPQAPLTRPANCGVLKQESVSTRLEGTRQKSYVCILTAFTLVSAV